MDQVQDPDFSSLSLNIYAKKVYALCLSPTNLFETSAKTSWLGKECVCVMLLALCFGSQTRMLKGVTYYLSLCKSIKILFKK